MMKLTAVKMMENSTILVLVELHQTEVNQRSLSVNAGVE